MSKSMFDETKLKKREKLTSGATANANTKKNKPIKKTHWLWFLLLLVVAVMTILFCVNRCTESEQPTLDEPTVIIQSIGNDTTTTTDIVAPKQDNVPAPETKHNVADNVCQDNKENVDVLLMAKKVIRGDYGNGNERKVALGINYQVIQDQVNLIYREGDLYW